MKLAFAHCWNPYHILEFLDLLHSLPEVTVLGIVEGTTPTETEAYLVQKTKLPLLELSQAMDKADGLLIAPSPQQCYEAIHYWLVRGKHLFSDKYYGMTGYQLAELQTLAMERRLQLRCEYPFLKRPLLLWVQEQLNSGRLGNVTQLQLHNGSAAWAQHSLPAAFLSYPQGVLYDLGIHPVYCALRLLGAPREISATGSHDPTTGALVHYTAQLTYNNATALLQGGYDMNPGGQWISLQATEGTLEATMRGGVVTWHALPSWVDPQAAPHSNLPLPSSSDLTRWLSSLTTAVASDPMFDQLFLEVAVQLSKKTALSQ